MSRRVLTAIAAVACAMVAAAPAWGVVASDPNDVAGGLDLRSVTATLGGSGLLTVTVRTWDPWSNGTLPAGSPNRLFVLFDVDSDGVTDYKARLLSDAGTLIALITGQGQAFEPVPVQRPSGAKARFAFPADVILLNGHVGVAARSVYKGGPCASACKDRAPDASWLEVVA